MLRLLLLLLAIFFFPLVVLISPLILLFRFGNYRSGPKIAIVTSGKWPYYLQYLRIPYDFAVWRAGGIPCTIAPRDLPYLDKILEKVSGIILTGGEDIDPQLQNGMPEKMQFFNSNRDRLEIDIIEKNAKYDLPLLCVCRGFQILTVYNGGHINDLEKHKLEKHTAEICHGTKLYDALGRDKIKIISIHHQIAGASGGLKICAYSENNDIEAIECPDAYWTLGVQWHPELLPFCRYNRRLFDRLIQKAVAYER